MNLPPWAHAVLAAVTAMLAAAQTLIPMSEIAHAVVAVALVGFAALGIVPPQSSKTSE